MFSDNEREKLYLCPDSDSKIWGQQYLNSLTAKRKLEFILPWQSGCLHQQEGCFEHRHSIALRRVDARHINKLLMVQSFGHI
ncbi:hypothetical protein HNY73_011185 [Argiope bruennichi]|uniref:Uncharacterized protein n=1 Tax=Argiope bruennichi TaxID=94029 RepID=A0A8T0F8D7_ARGBR|nr:hypothetical protein HNY73_011185 [Argiope bruennichi]